MDKTTGCAILYQGTGGALDVHTMAGRRTPVFLQILGPAPGVCPALAQDFPEPEHVAPALAGGVTKHVAPYISPFCVCVWCVCLRVLCVCFICVYVFYVSACVWEEMWVLCECAQ